MSKRLRNLTGLINEGRSRAPSMLSLFASASLSAAVMAEQAVLGVEGADREDLRKYTATQTSENTQPHCVAVYFLRSPR